MNEANQFNSMQKFVIHFRTMLEESDDWLQGPTHVCYIKTLWQCRSDFFCLTATGIRLRKLLLHEKGLSRHPGGGKFLSSCLHSVPSYWSWNIICLMLFFLVLLSPWLSPPTREAASLECYCFFDEGVFLHTVPRRTRTIIKQSCCFCRALLCDRFVRTRWTFKKN